ncbi:MAG: hypothetical protein HOK58_04165 [Acidimicrobiaceae bacterium]|nr:hypothetical protein [Acidimicrobiaceae bacterium]
MRDQFVLQFAPELEALSAKEREHVLNAGDLLTQLDAVDFLRRHRQLSPDDTHAVVAAALGALFR